MRFTINHDLLTQSRASLFRRDKLYWVVGGAGNSTELQIARATTQHPPPADFAPLHVGRKQTGQKFTIGERNWKDYDKNTGLAQRFDRGRI